MDSIAGRLQIDLDRPTRDLSSGNRRKVALLLAFAPKPDLLILDEPTSGLDPLDAARVPGDGRRGPRCRRHRLPLIARPERGPASGRSRRGPSRRADRRSRGRSTSCAVGRASGSRSGSRTTSIRRRFARPRASSTRSSKAGGWRRPSRDRSIPSLRSSPGIPSPASSWRNRTSRTPSSISMETAHERGLRRTRARPASARCGGPSWAGGSGSGPSSR